MRQRGRWGGAWRCCCRGLPATATRACNCHHLPTCPPASLFPRCSWLWLAVQRPEWSPGGRPTSTAARPPRFKSAVAALLLAAHRRGGGTGPAQRGTPLGALPPELLQSILDAAAYPLSAWLLGAAVQRWMLQHRGNGRAAAASERAA